MQLSLPTGPVAGTKFTTIAMLKFCTWRYYLTKTVCLAEKHHHNNGTRLCTPFCLTMFNGAGAYVVVKTPFNFKRHHIDLSVRPTLAQQIPHSSLG